MNLEFYQNGEYDKQIQYLNEATDIGKSQKVDWLKRTCLRGNRSAEATYYGIIQMQYAFFSGDPQDRQMNYSLSAQDNVLQVGLNVLTDDYKMCRQPEVVAIAEPFVSQVKKYKNTKNLVVFPYIWPCAFGDSVVMLQFMRNYKLAGNKVVAICPLNRTDLKELFACCDWIDEVIDITLLAEESNRHTTLTLNHPLGMLNVALQEYIVKEMLKELPNAKIVKLRYLPFLFGMENDPRISYGERIWEKRAQMWLNNKMVLPKIVEDTSEKKKKIVVHFREGKYGDVEGRDINPNYSQDLIDAIHKEYPQHEIIRLGDDSMTFLNNCHNASHAYLSVAEQIKEIQEAELFIGCHSAPQILAVACSDTPIICINYTAQETTTEMTDSVARLSYEPIGKQVKKIFYVKMFDKNNNLLIPTQNNPDRVRVEYEDIENIMKEVREVLG